MSQTLQIELQPKQKQVFDFLEGNDVALIGAGGAKGGGKVQPLDADVLTPFGFRKMSDVQVGSILSNPDGTQQAVIAIHPQGVVKFWRFVFDDGSTAEFGMDHLWIYKVKGITRYRKRKIQDRPTPWRVGATKQVMSLFEKGKKVCIPICSPVSFSPGNNGTALDIHPYAVGVVIGDGSITGSELRVTSADKSIPQKLTDCGMPFRGFYGKSEGKAKDYHYSTEHQERFKKIGLWGCYAWEKFIPAIYLDSSIENRFELMRGLMDTDGYADARGHASYTTTSERLSREVQWLAWSLGYKASITSKIPTFRHHGKKKDGRRAYTVWIKGDSHEKLFSLERKKVRAEKKYCNGWHGTFRTRSLKSISFSRETEGQCITVDNPNGLYITNDFIVTHNSETIIRIAPYLLDKYPGCKILIFRRKRNELNENHILPMMQRFKRLRRYYNKMDNLIQLPNLSTLKFGYAEFDSDIDSFNGKQYDFIFIDQSEQCTIYMLSILKSCRRSTHPMVKKPKLVLTFNPGGPSHTWHKKKFIDGILTPDEKLEGWGTVRIFAWDNVEWVRDELTKQGKSVKEYYSWSDDQRKNFFLEHSEYARTLRSLPDPDMVFAYLWGDFDRFSGQFFTKFRKDLHVVPDNVFEDPSWEVKGAIDYGGLTTVFYTGTRDNLGRVIIGNEVYLGAMAPSVKAEAIGNMLIARKLHQITIFGDTDMFSDFRNYRGSDKTVATIFREVWDSLMGKNAPILVPVSKKSEEARRYRLQCNEAFKEYLDWSENEHGVITKAPKMFFKESCKHLIETVPALMYDSNNTSDIDDRSAEDHPYDAAKYLLQELYTARTTEKEKTFEEDPQAWLIRKIDKDLAAIEQGQTQTETANYMYY